MDWLNIILVSLSMSVDASIVNITNGIKEKNIPIIKLCFIAFIFGLFQFLMPLLSYLIGYSFKNYFETYIPWISFILLSILAIKSFIEWLKDQKDSLEIKADNKNKLSFFNIFLQAIATSIDALCIGFVYIDYSLINALIVFSCIGVITFIISSLTGIFGKSIGKYIEKWAGLVASIVFLTVGIKILLEGIM